MKVGDLVRMRGKEVFGNNTVSWSKGSVGVVLSLRTPSHHRCYVYWLDGSKRGWINKHWLEVVYEGR
jgi:hypothetical protein